MKELRKFIKRLKAMIAEAEEYAKTHPFSDDRKDAQSRAATMRDVLALAEEIAGAEQPHGDATA